MTDLHLQFRLGVSTIGCIIQEVCRAIWEILRSDYMPIPTTEKWLSIAEGFMSKANFPNCIGALDGKHIRIIKPEHSGSMYFNYKHFFSVVLLAVCDSNFMFTFVDIGAYGKEGDSAVFRKSDFHTAMINCQLALPQPAPIQGFDQQSLPYVIVADEAFALSEHVMRPFGRSTLTTTKRKIYNYRHSRARRYIECAFGILSNKWRIFHRSLNVRLDLAEDITKAACILHNYVRSKDGYAFEDALTIEGVTPLQRDMSSPGTKDALSIREKFADYFMTPEGALPWQYGQV